MEGIWLARPAELGGGAPVAVKDLFDTAGVTTTYGSALFAEHVPRRSATAVELLERAGYAVAGKTNLHEFAYGISSQNPHFGTVPNPRFPGRLAGGSSGGSAAAVAAGDVALSLGTDSGGSIRIPAAWCGVVGFKPTYGLVPADGCFPLAPSYDHVGPIAATVEGCIELMRVLAGLDAAEPPQLTAVRVGVAWLEKADPLVRRQVERTSERFPDRRLIDFAFPHPTEYRGFMREVADVHRGLFPERADEYGDNVRSKIERCLAVTDDEVAVATQARSDYRTRCEEAMEGLDLLVTPTTAFVAPPADVDELAIRERGISLTFPFDSLGWPALALPCGPAEDGLPASMQLVGRREDDAFVLAVGSVLASPF
ncbi:MAG TPA: amidase [Gaiellaceae bacterium]|nr:amidase [Gaiellaceae bacterium]